jgi:ABC-2 type transport system ATP-binding protein
VIEARGLARTFRTRAGEVEAVSGIDLDVQAGEIVGFLGPNGAGKTTTLRMLTTLIAPSAGRARVGGHDLLREPVEVRRRIGYVAQGGCTEPEARVGEELVDHGRLYGMRSPRGARAAPSCCRRSTSRTSGTARPRRCRAASGGGWTSRWG